MSPGDGSAGRRPGRSCTVDLDGPVHYVDYGGPSGAPSLVLVHGLGGSHLNWDLVGPALARNRRVFAVDLPGFGLSVAGGRATTVPANVEVLDRFVAQVVGGPVVLVGNSMGGMISVLLAARGTAAVRGVVLVDPALPPTSVRPAGGEAVVFLHVLPGVGELVAAARRQRVGERATVLGMLRLCGVDPRALPADLLDRSIALAEHRRGDVADADRAFLSAARSLAWTLVRAREYRAAMAAVRVPVLLMHGDRDRLVPVSSARAAARRNPSWTYLELPGCGHVPQLQMPDRFVAEVEGWIGATRPEPGSVAG